MTKPSSRPVIGIVGAFQNGKSTLVNCLLDDKVARTGDGRATTKKSTRFTFGEFQHAAALFNARDQERSVPFSEYIASDSDGMDSCDSFLVTLWKPLLQHVDIVDTPGFYAEEQDDAIALASLEDLDLAVLVLRNRGLSEVEQSVLQAIGKRKLPFLVVMNCIETMGALWQPDSKPNQRIVQEIEARLRNIGHVPHPIAGEFVYPVNLAWFWHASGHLLVETHETGEDLREDVQAHFAKKRKSPPGPEEIAELSRFIPLRKHLRVLAEDIGISRSPQGKKALRLVECSREHSAKGELDEAMLYAERACYVSHGFFPALHSRAEICLAREEQDEAIDAATRALAIDARNIDTRFLRAKAYFAKRQFQAARRDLHQIAELLEGDWHIAWEESAKTEQARKYVETYLMKMECDQREGKGDEALRALRHIIDCRQNPMNVLDEAELHQIVWCLAAGLEFRAKSWEGALVAAENASAVCAQLEEPCGRLQELCKRFGLVEGDVSLCAPSKSLQEETQRLLWKACLAVHRSKSMRTAVEEFSRRNHLPVYPGTWKDEPLFLPHFISIVGSHVDDFPDLAQFVAQYFQATADTDLRGFCTTAQAGLKDGILKAFREATKPKCNVATSTVLLGNSVTVTNSGNPVLSDLAVEVSFKLGEVAQRKTLRMNKALGHGKQFHWADVFEGKGVFGGVFGGKRLSDVRIVKVNSAQGEVEVIGE